MSAQLVINGLDELRHVLKNLPTSLAEQSESIIDNRAEIARSTITQLYPRRTGNLRKGVRLKEITMGPYGRGRKVENRAPHAWLFEYGTEGTRFYTTKHGKRKSVGQMPPGRVFIPNAIRHKRILMTELVAMLERAGLVVTGVD